MTTSPQTISGQQILGCGCKAPGSPFPRGLIPPRTPLHTSGRNAAVPRGPAFQSERQAQPFGKEGPRPPGSSPRRRLIVAWREPHEGAGFGALHGTQEACTALPRPPPEVAAGGPEAAPVGRKLGLQPGPPFAPAPPRPLAT